MSLDNSSYVGRGAIGDNTPSGQKSGLLKKFTKPIAVGLLVAFLALPNVGCINRDRSAYLGGHLLKRVITEGVGNVMGSKEQPQQQNYVPPEVVIGNRWVDSDRDGYFDKSEVKNLGNRTFTNKNEGVVAILLNNHSGAEVRRELINAQTREVMMSSSKYVPNEGVHGRINLTDDLQNGRYLFRFSLSSGETYESPEFTIALPSPKTSEGDCSTKKD